METELLQEIDNSDLEYLITSISHESDPVEPISTNGSLPPAPGDMPNAPANHDTDTLSRFDSTVSFVTHCCRPISAVIHGSAARCHSCSENAVHHRVIKDVIDVICNGGDTQPQQPGQFELNQECIEFIGSHINLDQNLNYPQKICL